MMNLSGLEPRFNIFVGEERKRIIKISEDLKHNLGYTTEIDEAKEVVIKSIDEFESRILDYLPKLAM